MSIVTVKDWVIFIVRVSFMMMAWVRVRVKSRASAKVRLVLGLCLRLL
jgi:hypothetical protein